MGLRPTHRYENHRHRDPREACPPRRRGSGGPLVDSRLRGNDAIFERPQTNPRQTRDKGPYGPSVRRELRKLRTSTSGLRNP